MKRFMAFFRALNRFSRRLLRLVRIVLVIAVIIAISTSMVNPVLSFSGRALLIERSDSMAPLLRAGDGLLVEAKTAADLVPGDVVTLHSTERGSVTHRIVSTRPENGAIVVVTRGDANSGEETWQLPADERSQVLVRPLPKVGYALFWLNQAGVKVSLFVAMLLLTLRRRRPHREVSSVEPTKLPDVFPQQRQAADTPDVEREPTKAPDPEVAVPSSTSAVIDQSGGSRRRMTLIAVIGLLVVLPATKHHRFWLNQTGAKLSLFGVVVALTLRRYRSNPLLRVRLSRRKATVTPVISELTTSGGPPFPHSEHPPSPRIYQAPSRAVKRYERDQLPYAPAARSCRPSRSAAVDAGGGQHK